MNGKSFKRFLALLLCAVMALSSAGFPALADETEEPNSIVEAQQDGETDLPGENAQDNEINLPGENAQDDEINLPDENAQDDETGLPGENAQDDEINLPDENEQDDEINLPDENEQDDESDLPDENAQDDESDLPDENAQDDEINLPDENAQDDETDLPDENAQDGEAELPGENAQDDETGLPGENAQDDEINLPDENAQDDETDLPDENAQDDEINLPDENAQDGEAELSDENAQDDEPEQPFEQTFAVNGVMITVTADAGAVEGELTVSQSGSDEFTRAAEAALGIAAGDSVRVSHAVYSFSGAVLNGSARARLTGLGLTALRSSYPEASVDAYVLRYDAEAQAENEKAIRVSADADGDAVSFALTKLGLYDVVTVTRLPEQLDEPAEENADEPADEPAESNDGEPADEPAESNDGEPADEPAGENDGEPADEPARGNDGEPADEPAGENDGEPADEPAESNDGEPADEPAESNDGEPADEPAENNDGEPADAPDDTPDGGLTEEKGDEPDSAPDAPLKLQSPGLLGASADEITSWAQLQQRIDEVVGSATITLTQDITATSEDNCITIPGGKHITLDLNGCKIDRDLFKADSVENGGVFVNHGTLLLKNSASNEGIIEHGNTAGNGGGIYNDSTGILRIEDGVVIRTNDATYGGGIYNAGVLYFIGGELYQNHALNPDGIGAGIYNTGKINIAGAPKAWTNGSSNVYLANDNCIEVIGYLTGEKARFKVNSAQEPTVDSPVLIATGLHSGEESFFSEDPFCNYIVYADENGNAYLALNNEICYSCSDESAKYINKDNPGYYYSEYTVKGADYTIQDPENCVFHIKPEYRDIITFVGWNIIEPTSFSGQMMQPGTVIRSDEYYRLDGVWDTFWNTLQTRINNAEPDETIILTADAIALSDSASLVIPADKEIILDLNGHIIDGCALESGPVISVLGRLTLSGNGSITGGRSGSGAVEVAGTLAMTSGTITGNSGVGVKVLNESSVFEMLDGEISSNNEGGAALEAGARAWIGGDIKNNGGVGVSLASNASLTLGDEGAIQSNTGIGVSLAPTASFTQEGGAVTGNQIGVSFADVPSGDEPGAVHFNECMNVTGNTDADIFLGSGATALKITYTDAELPDAKAKIAVAENTVTADHPFIISKRNAPLSDEKLAEMFESANTDYFIGVNELDQLILGVKATVTFQLGEADGTMDRVPAAVGGVYTLPDCTVAAPPARNFGGWMVDGTLKFAGEKITITNVDTTLIAYWVSGWGGLQLMINSAPDGAIIDLQDDQTYTATDEDHVLTIPAGKTLTIRLKGKTLDRGLGSALENAIPNGGVLKVLEGADLTLIGPGVLTGGNTDDENEGGRGGGALVLGKLTLEDNVEIKNNTGYDGGGGVCVSGQNAELIMNGGEISENKGHDCGGGGVLITGGAKFTFNNGRINNNSEIWDGAPGGGVMALSGQFVMNGGEISGNSAVSNGGGVAVMDGSSMTITGGEITGNTSDQFTNGVYLSDGAVFSLSGAPLIRGNSRQSTDNKTVNANVIINNEANKIAIVGELSADAEIGVKPSKTGAAFTSGLSGRGTNGSFSSDLEGFLVGMDENGEALLEESVTVTYVSNYGQGYELYETEKEVPAAPGTKLNLLTAEECGFAHPGDKPFGGWLVNGEVTPAGEEITVTESMTISAVWLGPWALLQQRISQAQDGVETTILLSEFPPYQVYTVTADSTDNSLIIPSGKIIILDMNDCTLDRGLADREQANGNVITVKSGGTLTLTNGFGYGDTFGHITGGCNTGDGGGVIVEAGGTLTVEKDVIITGNYAGGDGGGISNSGTLNLTGGKIAGNTANLSAGGVRNWGSGVFDMCGGEISNNEASRSHGGGVYNGGIMNLSGGLITNNQAHSSYAQGGAILNQQPGTLNISGNPVIRDNSATTGSNLYLRPANGNSDITNVIHITAPLTSGAEIHVYTEKMPRLTAPQTITSGLNEGEEAYFFADDSGYIVGLTENGEAALAVPVQVRFSANGGDGNMDSDTAGGGLPYPLPDCGFTAPLGQRFAGWQVGEETKQPKDTAVFTADSSVSAVWEDDPNTARIQEATASFNDKIKLNFYLNIPETVSDGAYALISCAGQENRLPAADNLYESHPGGSELVNKYKFSYSLVAKQVEDTVTLQLFDAQGEKISLIGASKDYTDTGVSLTLLTYLDYMIGSSDDQKMSALALATKDYCYAAKQHFNNEDCSASISPNVANVAQDALDGFVSVPSGTMPQGVSIESITAMFESDNSFRLYLKFGKSYSPNGFTYQLDGNNTSLRTRSDGNRYLTFAGVVSNKLNAAHTLTISDGADTYSVEVSVLTYARAALKSASSSDHMKTLAKALYLYNQAARAKFGD